MHDANSKPKQVVFFLQQSRENREKKKQSAVRIHQDPAMEGFERLNLYSTDGNGDPPNIEG